MSSSKKLIVCLTVIWLFKEQQIVTDVSPDVKRLLSFFDIFQLLSP